MKGQSLVGEIIAGRYELLSVAGSGAMGVVYKARQTDLDRFVAIKFLDPDFVSDDEFSSRFQMEARALSQLMHKNIGGFYAFGALENGSPYIVMEFLEGQSLSSVISIASLPPERIVCIAIQIASGMSSAHQKQLVHRDLKPGNILLLKQPEPDSVKVVDFGLAKHVAANPAYTRTGQLVGTPQYLSPEQCRGQKNIDQRADIYAFGCILYEMLVGVPPFDADSPVGYVYKHLNEKLSFPSELSNEPAVAAICSIIMHCMEKEPAHRYGSMSEIEQDLLCIKEKRYSELAAPHVVRGRSRTVKRFYLLAVVAILVMSIAALALPYLVTKRSASMSDEAMTSGLLEQIKRSETQKLGGAERAQVQQLKQVIRRQNKAGNERAAAFLRLAQGLQGYPIAANLFAISAIQESFAEKTSKFSTMKDSRYESVSHLKEAVVGSVDVGRLIYKRVEDEEKQFNAASIIDKASQILLDNDFVADRNLLLSLIKANRLLALQQRKQFAAFNEFACKSAEKSQLRAEELLELYRRRADFLFANGSMKEAVLIRQKVYALAVKIYGDENQISINELLEMKRLQALAEAK